MAAAYETGISTSPTNLLNELASFLVAQGWTQDSLANDGTGRRLHAHKGSVYANFKAAENETIWTNTSSGNYNNTAGYGIGLYLGTGYSGASAWNAQAGRPVNVGGSSVVGVGMRLPSGNVVGYHFFDDGNDNIMVVVEITPGKFQYLGFGITLVKRGYSWDAPYFFGSLPAYYTTANPASATIWGFVPGENPGWPMAGFNSSNAPPNNPVSGGKSSGFVWVDSAVFSANWVGVGSDDAPTGLTALTDGHTGRQALGIASVWSQSLIEYPHYGLSASLSDAGTLGTGKMLHATAFTRAMLIPTALFYFDTSNARWTPMGYVDSVYRFTGLDPLATGYSQKQIIAIGGRDYMIFPRFAVYKGA